MRQYELLMIAVSLSMDAFAVSVCKGLAVGRPRLSHCVTCGCWFGGFQALMPLAGWLLGVRFQGMIVSVDHWIAFILLSLIGFSMVRESRAGADETLDSSFAPRAMLPLAVATSIDALAVGVTFAFLQADILPAVCLIGATTFPGAGGADRGSDSDWNGGKNSAGAHPLCLKAGKSGPEQGRFLMEGQKFTAPNPGPGRSFLQTEGRPPRGRAPWDARAR